MLSVASFVFVYYSIWALFLVRVSLLIILSHAAQLSSNLPRSFST